MSLEQNKAIALKMYQAFDRQDIDQGREFIAADIIGQGMDGVLRQGVNSFMEYAMSMFKVFPDGYHQVNEIIAEGNKVVTRGIFYGSHQGELMSIPPTGKQIQFSFVHIDRVVENKIVEHWGIADLLIIMQQLKA